MIILVGRIILSELYAYPPDRPAPKDAWSKIDDLAADHAHFRTNLSLLVKLEGVNDKTTTKKFTNQSVYYPANVLPEEDGNESWTRFIGYLLTDEVLGEIGTVTDVDESTANIVFRVDDQGKERLIPIAAEMICSIDERNKHITVSLPVGILDLN